MSSKTIIHIGMPKCASTTLQNNFFKKLPISYLGRYNTLANEYDRALSLITRAEILNYKDIEHEINKIFKDNPEKSNKPTVISSEGFVIGNFWSRNARCDRYTVASRLKSIFPDANILLIIRNQFDFIKSFFFQNQKMQLSTFNGDFNALLDIEKKYIQNNMPCVFLPIANYYEIYKIYSTLFSSNQIKVMLFEDFVNDWQHFINDLTRFIDIDFEYSKSYKNEQTNKRTNEFELKLMNSAAKYRNLLKYMPAFFKNSVKKASVLPFLKKTDFQFNDSQKTFINNYYKESNQKLAETCNLNLTKYNYPQ